MAIPIKHDEIPIWGLLHQHGKATPLPEEASVEPIVEIASDPAPQNETSAPATDYWGDSE
ncbi:MAG: hypothetical protein ACFB10_24765 [Salibacteraceae bacterium]